MKFKYYLLSCLVLLLFTPHVSGYTKNSLVKFQEYSISDGLSHLGVSSFYQDSKGFLWIGTYDGLNRFDGSNFKVFKHTPDDSTTIINNRVRSVIEHSSGKIFIGTEGGLCIYDPEYELFNEYKLEVFNDKTAVISKIFEDSQRRLWVLTNKSIVYVINTENDDVKNLFFVSNRGRNSVTFNDIVEDKFGYIWLATSNGLICYGADIEQVTVGGQSLLTPRQIRSVELDSDNNLWLANGTRVRQFAIEYVPKNIQLSLKYDFQIQSNALSILADSKGYVWVGSSNEGVFKVVSENDKKYVENYRYNPLLQESLSSNWINDIYEDKYGDIWFATSEKGVNKYAFDKGLFFNVDESLGLSNNYVMDLFQYDDEKLLCGTKNGFSVFNLKTGKIEKAWFDDIEMNGRNIQVSDACRTLENTILFGLSNGIFYLKPGKGKQTGFLKHAETDLSDWYVLAFAEDKFGNIWVGTTLGLFRITLKDEPVISEILDFNAREDETIGKIKVSDIYIDPIDQSIWVGSWYKGLFHIQLNGNEKNSNDFIIQNYRFETGNPKSIRSNFISSIHRTKKGELWIGTEGGGLGRFTNSGFKHFTEEHGLSNNVVKSIVEDAKGKLYLGTNYKLNVFDPETESFTYYDVSDGLNSAFFNSIAIKLQNEDMAFGGNEGFTIFNPSKLEDKRNDPVPEFGDFLLSYKEVHPADSIDGKILLQKSLAYTNTIKLKHYQNTFSFEMLGINFDDPEDTYYKYHLKDYDPKWIVAKSSNNMASYSNVSPGEYLFEFYVSNSKNEWYSAPKQLKVVISPPFWKTGWAYFLYVVIFFTILFFVFYFIIKLERLKSNLRIEQLEKEKEKEINDIKLRFFTNISHEFKTPVSLILGPAENLIQKFKSNDSVKRNLLMINEQANYLLRLVDQLLEFRKVEKEKLKLNCVEKDIVSFVKNIVKGFDPKSIEKNIRCDFNSRIGTQKIWFDPSKIEMIMYNLLSNAFKFTPSGGIISMQINKDIDFVIIKVTDNGPGIPKEEEIKIFERFYQSNSTAQLHGTGIGLTLSKSLTLLHKGELFVESDNETGATFILKLRIGQNHLNEEDKIEGSLESIDELVYETNYISPYLLENETNADKQKLLPMLLLVEDNFQMRKYLEEIMSEYYQVITAENGHEGFNLALKKVPEIIVSDVMMPEMDGVQLVEKLKNEIITSHIPIILLTVENESESYIKGIKTGADDFMSKPFHIEHLLVRIKNLLENRSRLRARYGKEIKDDLTNPDEQFSSRDTEFIHTLLEIAEQNLDNSEFSPDDFSKAVFMSRTNFYKKIKALTDQTPGEFLRIYRVKKASELLKTGQYSVSQVTQMVGFKSRSYFYQCFKSFYGELPAEFIRNKNTKPS